MERVFDFAVGYGPIVRQLEEPFQIVRMSCEGMNDHSIHLHDLIWNSKRSVFSISIESVLPGQIQHGKLEWDDVSNPTLAIGGSKERPLSAVRPGFQFLAKCDRRARIQRVGGDRDRRLN